MYSHNLLLERSQRAIVDGIAVFLGALVVVWIRNSSGLFSDTTPNPWPTYLFPAAIVAALTVIVLHLFGSYREPHRVVHARTHLGALTAATVMMLTMSFFYRTESYSRATVMIFPPVALLVLIGMRFGYDRYAKAIRRSRAALRRVLIVGRTPTGIRLGEALEERPAYYELVGFVDDSADGTGNGSDPVLGRVSALGHLVDELAIDEVLICLPDDSDRAMHVIGECMRRKVTWKAVPNMFGLRLERISVDNFDGIPLVGPHSTRLVGFSWMLKRGFDTVIAVVALILLSPILLAVAVVVRITSRGSVLFRQTRVGLNGRLFTMLKFRSMRTGISAEIHNEYTQHWIYGRTGSGANGDGSVNDTTGAHPSSDVHKITNDPRITTVGKVLRATSLDELPQFWNVLRGEMSIVGPRPALPYEVDRYTEWHRRRLAVPPGITGAWQVSGRSDLSFEEMVELDINYIERWSVENDIRIVLKTVPAVLKFGGK